MTIVHKFTKLNYHKPYVNYMRLEIKNGRRNFRDRKCRIGTSAIEDVYKTSGWINRKI
jgi:hypothetical protein